MTDATLESRVAALEEKVQALSATVGGTPTAGAWWSRTRPPMSPEEEEAFRAMVEYGRYWRKTGTDAPPDWKPGDPIPEPEYDE